MALPKDSDRIRISSTLRKDLYTGLQEYSKLTDVPMTRLLDRAVEAYLLNVGFDPKRIEKE